MRTVLSLLLAAAVAFAAFCVWMYSTQRSQMYFPTPDVSHPSAQARRIDSKGETLKVWVVGRPGPRAFIYFGGNAEDVAGSIDEFSRVFPGHSLYFVNYRGYGGSSGRPSESALFADSLAVFDHVRNEHPDITVMGRSLGSAVAVYLASKRPVAKLVLVTAFDSLVNVAKSHFRWLPVGLLMRDRYDSAGRVQAVSAPVLVVIAERDEIIPRPRSDALVRSFPADQVRVEVIRGAMHNTLDLSSEYLGCVRRFVVD